MSALVRRPSLPWVADLFDWMESPWEWLFPFTQAQPFRVEDYMDEGRYVVRAELPGLDPEKDVEVAVERGVLTIRAERREEKQGPHRSEFRYGAFARSVTLPADAATEKITARYDQGILEVSVPVLQQDKPQAQRITIGSAH